MAKPKSDIPPLLMEKSGLKLAPASAADEERFDTFANGKMWVTINQETPPKMIRTWWAVLNTVIKSCPSPWANAEQASAAIKLALGHCTPFKTVGGQWRAEAKSLHEFNSEKDAWEFLDLALSLLEKITGVPRDELIVNAPDTGPDKQASPDPTPRDTGDGSGDELTPSGSASDKPSEEDPAPNGASEAEGGGPTSQSTATLDQSAGEADPGDDGDGVDSAPSSPSGNVLKGKFDECIDKFLELATREGLEGDLVKARCGLIEGAVPDWKAQIPEEHHDQLKEILTVSDKVAKGEQQADVAKRYLRGLVGLE